MAQNPNRLWLTWETQRRNQELASAFGCEFYAFDESKSSPAIRYLVSSVKTVLRLFASRPRILFAQSPSIVLGALVAFLKSFLRYQLLIDAHNSSVEAAADSGFLGALVRYSFRKANYVIVSNPNLISRVQAVGGTGVVLPDKLPAITPSSKVFPSTPPQVLFVSTFASDEPTEDFISGALLVREPFTLYITGKKKNAGDLLRFEGDRVRFTDFLPQEEYDRMLAESDLVVDLTTREDCLVCGAYEAISSLRPVMVSDFAVNREFFPTGCIFVKNAPEEYARGIELFFAEQQAYQEQVRRLKVDFQHRWQEYFQQIESSLTH